MFVKKVNKDHELYAYTRTNKHSTLIFDSQSASVVNSVCV